MAENNQTQAPQTPTPAPVRLAEGARVLVQCTVNEHKAEGQILKDGPYEVRTRVEGERYIQRNLVYPFPAGLCQDPFTGKEPVAMTPTQLARSVEAWSKQIDELKAAGGRVVTVLNGKDEEGVVPIDVIPSTPEIFNKGFKLEIQGPVNADMRKAQLVVKGKAAGVTKAAKTITKIG